MKKKKKEILTKPFAYITIGGKSYVCEVVNDEEKRLSGLSRRTKLEKEHGMLFEFDDEGIHAFQMKDSYIPLDIIFIGKDKKIVDYIPNVQPLTNGPYKPKEECLYVLEVPGNSLKDKIKIGDSTRFKYFDTEEECTSHKEEKSLAEGLTLYLSQDNKLLRQLIYK